MVLKSEVMLKSADMVQTSQNVQLLKCMYVVTLLFRMFSAVFPLTCAAGDGFNNSVEKASLMEEQASAVTVHRRGYGVICATQGGCW